MNNVIKLQRSIEKRYIHTYIERDNMEQNRNDRKCMYTPIYDSHT